MVKFIYQLDCICQNQYLHLPDCQSIVFLLFYHLYYYLSPLIFLQQNLRNHIWIDNNLNIKQPHYTTSPRKWNPEDSRIILNTQKHHFVNDEYDILIDDTPKKINAWRKSGGIGILHKSADSTINKLKKILKK